MVEVSSVDAHAGGSPVRLVTAGAPTPRGGSMREKTQWMARHGDHIRQLLMLEPRGHRDMTGTLLTEPVSPGSDAGLIFMHAGGYAPLAGHAVIGTTLLALSRGLIVPRGDGRSVVFDTVAGTIRARVEEPVPNDLGVSSWARVSYTGVPSFVLAGGVTIIAAGRRVRADVAFGGVFYAIVDAESIGLSASLDQLPALRRISHEIAEAVNVALTVAHPLDPRTSGLAGTLFTAPPHAGDAHLRSVAVLDGGSAGRAASGTGLSAVMAVLDAMGLLGDGEPVVLEGVAGQRLRGRIANRTTVGETPGLVATVDGSAWVTGEHRFVADPADPFARGMPLS